MTSRGILEQAVLHIKPGLENDFEAAFATAQGLISGMPGFIALELSRGIERPGSYLLLVRWHSLEDHEIGFRGSAEYQQWRALLHHFYEPFPVMEHYSEISRARRWGSPTSGDAAAPAES